MAIHPDRMGRLGIRSCADAIIHKCKGPNGSSGSGPVLADFLGQWRLFEVEWTHRPK